jgi:DNA polymerase-4
MILHIDMDAFFASVEQLDNPDLAGQCVIVGGLSSRSVVSAASYEARKFGVHSAMPMYQARQKCPQAIFLQPRMDRYKALSKKIMSLLKAFSPCVEPISIDEAYLDITGCEKLYGEPQEIAVQIKRKIKQTFNLTCSIGIGTHTFIAKIASDMHKPDGLTVIAADQTSKFIDTLPIHKVPGVGKRRHKQLDGFGVKTLGDVRTYPRDLLLKRLGKFGQRLLDLIDGIDGSPSASGSRRKSVSSEKTLPHDIKEKKLLHHYILMQSETVARQLRKMDSRAKTITLKIKHSDFKQVTRSVTLPVPTQSSKTVFSAAENLLKAYQIKTKIRLIGVGASGLVPASVPVQMNMFERSKKKTSNWEKVDKAMDTITQKFGKNAIKRGTLGEP